MSKGGSSPADLHIGLAPMVYLRKSIFRAIIARGMELGRAAKYGTIGALGVILISLGTIGLSQAVWADRISGFEGRAIDTIMIVGVGGTALTILFLFVVIGAFIDAELEARELGNPEE